MDQILDSKTPLNKEVLKITMDRYLDTFTGRDYNLRPALTKIHLDGDMLVATDAYVIVICPKYYCKEEYVPVEKYPNYKAVLPEEYKWTLNLSFDPKKFTELYDTIDKYDIYDDCPECKGDKKVKCEYHHYHECPECSGSGTTTRVIGYRPIAQKDVIKFKTAIFDLAKIQRIVFLASGLNERINIVYISENNNSAIFKVKDIIFYVMAIHNNVDGHDEPSNPTIHELELEEI